MVRVLVMIAVAGFFVSLVTLTSAVAIGGPEVFENAAWDGWGRGHWSRHGDIAGWAWDDDGWDRRHGGGGETSRDIAWSGGDTLDIEVPADVEYTQGPVAKVTVTGPERAVEDVEIEGGHIQFAHGHHRHWGDLRIAMTAPSVTRFEISGSGKLAIAGYKQERLDIHITGNGDATAAGETGDLSLDVSGSGDADLGALKARSADVDISGSGEAKLAPTDQAKVRISGSGDVTLLTHPPRLDSNISGSGSLHQEAGAPEPASPAQPAAPAPPRKGKT